ncbi:TonB-dependent receptor SusC [termite gut metagenome]|uniref:TonB-dependent receptor SusC n=1 Tax=termite gut metagenome TaxID=433724 RepID=A0A5J4SSQ0_9ZZZZ
MQESNMTDMHPNDIESLEVLKDTSATAIYGSRGAAGGHLNYHKGDNKEPSITYNDFFTLQHFSECQYNRANNNLSNQTLSSVRLELLREGIQDYEKIKNSFRCSTQC